MGEGRGEGENTAISTSYVSLPFIPSHQGRGNPIFYETVNIQHLKFCGFAALGGSKNGNWRIIGVTYS